MGWKGANTKANQKKRHRKQRKKKDGSEERLFQDYLGQDKSLIAAQAEELFVVDVPNGKGKNEKPTKTEFFQQKKLASEIIAQDARKHLTSVTRSSGTSKPSIFLFNKISNLSKRSDLPSYHQIINQNKNSNQLPSSNQNTSTIANFNLWEDESALITEEEMEAKGNPWIKKEVTSKPVPRRKQRANFQDKFNTPEEGLSYNPSYDAHQNHLKKVHVQALIGEKRKTFMNSLSWTPEKKIQYWKQHFLALKEKRNKDANLIQEQEPTGFVVKKKKAYVPFKSKTQKAFEKRKANRTRVRTRQVKKSEDLERAMEIATKIDEEAEKRRERKMKREENRKLTREEISQRKLMKTWVEPFLLTEEIPKSLRAIPAVSKPVNEFITNLQKRKIIELPTTKRNKKMRSSRPERHYFKTTSE
eukprot:TRINITY_DN3686_c0_g1_i1.p1 TRINITY_DN3686_c0_g1~~TRINITY_DN3686_c0_g1_i1.p1  ORF type:complete len:416 (-),score=132.44 TRINITY_DN3686_c0_g1_i1:174-1421(-)